MSIGRTTFFGFLWSAFGTWGHGLVQLLTLVLLARVLTPEDFGLAAIALVVVAFGRLFAQIGVAPALVQRQTLEDRHVATGFVLSVGLGLGLGVLIFALADPLAGIMRMEGLAPVVAVSALAFPIQSLATVSEALLQRQSRFRALAVSLVVSQALGFLLVAFVLALLGWGALALAVAGVAQVALRSALLVGLQLHKVRGFDARAGWELIGFGGGHTLAKLGNQIALQGDYIVTGRWLGAEALGLYTRAYQLMTLPASVIGGALDMVLFPAMARLQGDRDELARWFLRGSGAVALLTLPASAAVLVLAPEIVLVLLGAQWTGLIPALYVLALGMTFRTSYKISDTLAKATGAVYRRAWRQGLYAVAVLAGAWIGQHWGIEGVAAGVLAALGFNFVMMSGLSLSLLDLKWGALVRVHAAPVLAALCVAGLCLGAASVLRAMEAPAVVTLLGVGGLVAAVAGLVVRLRVRAVLGEEGLWLLDAVGEILGRRARGARAGS